MTFEVSGPALNNFVKCHGCKAPSKDPLLRSDYADVSSNLVDLGFRLLQVSNQVCFGAKKTDTQVGGGFRLHHGWSLCTLAATV